MNFDVSRVPEGSKVEPSCVRQVAMCLRGDWYRLDAKDGTFPAEDPVKSLDVQVCKKERVPCWRLWRRDGGRGARLLTPRARSKRSMSSCARERGVLKVAAGGLGGERLKGAFCALLGLSYRRAR